MSGDLTSEEAGATSSIPTVNLVVTGGIDLPREVTAHLKRNFDAVDIIFEPSFVGETARACATISDGEARWLAQYRRLGSDEEYNLFDAATDDIARLATAVADVKVSNAETGAAWAVGQRALIFRELYAAHALEKIFAEGHKRISIVVRRISACESALVMRLMDYERQGRVRFNGVLKIANGRALPFDPPGLLDTIARLRHVRSEEPPELSPSIGERLVSDMDVFEGAHPGPADVLFLHLTANRMFHANIPPILSELQSREKNAVVFALEESGLEIYDSLAEKTPQNIVRMKSDLNYPDEDQIERLSLAIRDRVNRIGAELIGLSAMAPLFVANNPKFMRQTLSRLMNFHRAFNVILGRSKPNSLFVSQSPDTHPLAYLALSIGGTRIMPFYAFSAFITEDTRSLPFIAPARLLAYGEHDRDIVAARSELAGKAAIVTGMPSLDGIIAMDNVAMREKLYSDHDFPAEQPIIAIKMSRLEPDTEDRWLLPFVRWCSFQGYNVVLAENQRKGTQDYKKAMGMAAARGWENIVSVAGVDATNAALAGAHIVISDQPEFALAGMIAGRVFIQAKIGTLRGDSVGDGTGFLARSEMELRDIVTGVLLDEDYIPEALLEQRSLFESLLNASRTNDAAQRVVEALLSEKQDWDFDNPFGESRLIDSPLQKLSVVPKVNVL